MSLISHASIMSKTSDRILADTHVHTEFSGDSTAPVHSQIEQALALGSGDSRAPAKSQVPT